jgi:hypothetical protein
MPLPWLTLSRLALNRRQYFSRPELARKAMECFRWVLFAERDRGKSPGTIFASRKSIALIGGRVRLVQEARSLVRSLQSAGPENYFEPRILAVRNSTAIRIATIVAVVKASDRMTSGARPTWTWTICRNAAAVSTAAARIATSRLTRNTMIGSITLIRTILGWARQGPFDIGGLR